MPLFLVFSAKVGTMGFTPLVLNVRAWRHCPSLGLLASGPSRGQPCFPSAMGRGSQMPCREVVAKAPLSSGSFCPGLGLPFCSTAAPLPGWGDGRALAAGRALLPQGTPMAPGSQAAAAKCHWKCQCCRPTFPARPHNGASWKARAFLPAAVQGLGRPHH